MQSYKFPRFSSQSGIKLFLLLVLWTFGMILGVMAGEASSGQSVSLMRRALFAPVSIVSLLICAALPFAFTAASVLSGRMWLVYVFCLCKAFAFAYTGSVCIICLGSAGWLARTLLMFSQIAVIPALWYVWLSLCTGNRLSQRSLCLLCSYLVAVVLFDYFRIVPYLANLSS